MSLRPYTLAPLPTKVENFIKRLDRATQARIDIAFEYIVRSPFQHENPTTVKPLHGKKKGFYRYRIGIFVLFIRLTEKND